MKYFIINIMALLLVACSTADDLPTSEDGVEIAFSMNIQENTSVSLLRSSSYDDSSIRCVDLLVFDEHQAFMERIQVNSIENSGDTRTFSARILPTGSARSIYVIGNGRDLSGNDIINFSELSSGMSMESVAQLLKTTSLYAYTSPQCPLIMWGRADLTEVRSGTTINNINMIRMVAAMKMECETPTEENGLADFSLTGFTLLQSSAFGKVIPSDYTSSNSLPASVSLPSGIQYINYVNTEGAGVWNLASSNATSDIYLYERSNILGNMGISLIIRGKYKGVDGYYKIWLTDGNKEPVSPVRNHRYLTRISRVSGSGYLTLQEAVAADYTADIFFEIIDNNDDITDIVVDAKYELGVSSNRVSFSGSGTKTIGTVLSTNTAVTLTAVADVDWITGLSFSGSGNRYILSGSLLAAPSARQGNIIVRAGNLVRTITVEQQP